MPHASLLAMTSPILLGSGHLVPVTTGGIVETTAAMPQVAVAAIQLPVRPTTTDDILPLNWSLADVQSEPEGPPSEGATERGSEDPDAPEIVVEGEYGPPEGDPMGAINQTSFEVTQRLDSVFVEPAATVYRSALPDPLRDGLGNVVRNLREPANFLNFLLQFKIGDAAETLGRFAINSTLGVGGLFDVAGSDAIGLPYRRNGFANTLGYYGVDTGAYLYLPITGPTTVRDLIGDTLDQAVLPIGVGRPFNTPEYGIPYFVISNLDSRVEIDEELERMGETVDPYATRRDVYLWRRERDIAVLKGEEPPPRPDIVREIEEGVEFDDDAPGDAPPIMEDGAGEGAPQISYAATREPMRLAAAVTITQPMLEPRTR